jgi:hypothetical protein
VQKDDKLLNTKVRTYKNEGKISGIIGIITFGGTNYLGVISEHSQVATLRSAKINKI